MKVLIVGSKGFIGQHIYRRFSNLDGYDCWACDVAVDYIDKNYFIVDGSSSDFNEIFETVAFDVCINCSGAASVPDSLLHPLRDFTLNTFNVIKILEAIRRHAPSCRFLNLSSAAVYGNPLHLPISENQPAQPVSPYGLHKKFAEEICWEYHHYFKIQTCSLRIFSAYGPGLKKQLFWDIFQKASGGSSLNLFGTGNETRDFIYIDDIIQAIETVLLKGSFAATIYNVASGTETSIKDAVSSLITALGFEGKILFSSGKREGDPLNWRADITELRKIGFEPKVFISEGVKKYVEWLREERLH